ncbi:MAG: hypothetical protein F6J97_19130 [Leptolyngbya sp. SIO4C1]|nr:hypothetical protein [Leptolyngbya sp. SIO4C1]
MLTALWTLSAGIFASVVLLYSFASESQDSADREPPIPELSISALVHHPDIVSGKVVKIRGRVDDMVETSSFILENMLPFHNEKILVLQPDTDSALSEGSVVEVMGEVQTLSSDKLAQFSWHSWSPATQAQLLADFEDEPVLIARAIQRQIGDDVAILEHWS